MESKNLITITISRESAQELLAAAPPATFMSDAQFELLCAMEEALDL